MKAIRNLLLAALLTPALLVSYSASAQNRNWDDKDQEKLEKKENKWKQKDGKIKTQEGKWKEKNGKWKAKGKNKRRDWDDPNVVNGQERVYPYSALNIPPGHLPPPGECRYWYPNLPAGQQPPPQPCGSAAPAGAWLVTNEGQRYRVNMDNDQRNNTLERVRYYLAR